jgi:SpoIID/LytB domain protein
MNNKKVISVLLSSTLVLSLANSAYAATILKYGMRSPEVRHLQQNLNKAGYFVTANPTDYFGPATKNAVMRLQKDYNLVPDGIYGPLTEKALMDKLNAISKATTQTSNTSLQTQSTVTRTLKYGMQGNDVKELQNALAKLGYFNTTPTGYFGSITRDAVIKFQKANNLTPDGIVGPLTQKAISEKLNVSLPSRGDVNRSTNTTQNSSNSNQTQSTVTRTLKYGMQGNDVKELQNALAKLGYFNTTPTGYFGSITRDAVIKFQKANNLTPDGIVGPLTQKAIQGLLAGKDQQASQPTDSPKIQYPSGFSRNMKKGDTGDDVKLLQTLLKEIGYYTKDITGTYDDNTLNAVMDFQKYYSLAVDGIAGINTITKVIEINNQVKAVKGFYVQGKGGYGHGVGMTQFGAKGMAEQEYKYDEIIKYYYTGVNIEKRNTDNVNIKVKISLDLGSPDINITSDQPYSVVYKTKDNDTEQIVENQIACPAQSTTSFKYMDGNIVITNDKVIDDSTQLPQTIVSIDAVRVIPSDTGVLSYINKGNPLPYAGEFKIYPNNSSKNLDLINILPLEEYLRGVVPAEMPSSWHEEALKAQTLAARTYALRRISDKKIFDVYDSTLSQAYKGLSVVNDKVDNLIKATKGEVVTYNGGLADTVYSASAGGYTVDSTFAWGGSDVPYLKGKPDPYDNSEYATYWWNVNITRDQISSAYPQVGVVLNVEITNKMFDRPVELKITGTKGTIVVKNKDFRDAIEKAVGKKLFISEYYTISLQK